MAGLSWSTTNWWKTWKSTELASDYISRTKRGINFTRSLSGKLYCISSPSSTANTSKSGGTRANVPEVIIHCRHVCLLHAAILYVISVEILDSLVALARTFKELALALRECVRCW